VIADPVREALRAWAAGWGQVFFSPSPTTGLCLVLGFSLLAPRAALAGAVTCAASTLVARARGYPRLPWRSGLYGYAGVLAGLYWGVLFEPSSVAWLMLLLAGLVAAPLTRLAHRLLTRREIPTLALPALALLWLSGVFLAPAAPVPPTAAGWQLAGWGIIAAGLALHSRLLVSAAVAGAGIGLAASASLVGRIEPGLISNSVATAMALGAVYLPFSVGSLALGGLGAAMAGALWWAAAPAAAAGLPLLLAPFHAVTLAILGALGVRAIRRRLPGCPAPLPLESIETPERSRAVWQARHRLHALVRGARRIGVLTGAGVSTEAGLPDVRSAFGLWLEQRGITLDEFLASTEARAEYWRQEESFFRLVRRAAPAAVHRALATFYRRGRLSAVVTQNVDGLHQAAGLPREAVIELHGNIHEARCVDCGQTAPRAPLSERIAAGSAALYCDGCQGLLKGGGLLFGEQVSPERLEAAVGAVLTADLCLVLGTSLTVAPASDLLRWARDAGVPIAIVNATPTAHDALAAVTVTAEVGTTLLDLLEDAGPDSPAPAAVSPAAF
jgi:NAD-dependent deacetylase